MGKHFDNLPVLRHLRHPSNLALPELGNGFEQFGVKVTLRVAGE
jgi:hypothetical protein